MPVRTVIFTYTGQHVRSSLPIFSPLAPDPILPSRFLIRTLLHYRVILLILLNFYHRKGYNTQWAITDDNSEIGMYRDEKGSDQEVMKALENLNKVIHNKFS